MQAETVYKTGKQTAYIAKLHKAELKKISVQQHSYIIAKHLQYCNFSMNIAHHYCISIPPTYYTHICTHAVGVPYNVYIL